MGNFFSSTNEAEEQITCIICNARVEKADYIDLGCSQCKNRIKGHFHNDCFHNYVDEYNGIFVCFDCKYKKENKETNNPV
jgi:hypothetical protein